MKTFTKEQLTRLMNANKYIQLRTASNKTVALNCKVINMGRNATRLPNEESGFISYRIISFQEYISKKLPFIKINQK